MAMCVVIVLLLVIVVLLCVPVSQRRKAVSNVVWLGVIGLVLYNVLPLLLELTVVGFSWGARLLHAPLTFAVVAGIIFLVYCVFAWHSDQKENAAIRSGSDSAFNRRVEILKSGSLKYSHDQAVEAVKRLRDEK
ncbi:MAG: hypothetical protein BGO25_02645 [Acidobacteriales bacterium 59-55]|nr:hypothetical protein [Terriglobales bacterium]OJV42418.1 MAG: hypothetical protein BGO25_02645 [Acidobacteriales bacterium 59-55]